MIYITHSDGSIKNVIKSDYNDLKEQYSIFLSDKAEKLNIKINPHWFNIMNHEDHHNGLSKNEYKKLVIRWDKVLAKWSFDDFVLKKNKGKKIKFKAIY